MTALEYTAAEGDAGRRVYHLLKNRLRFSAEGIRRAKNAGAVYVNGESVHMDRLLAPGDRVSVALDRCETPPDFPPERGPLEILYENQGLLAVNKPEGMLVHPSRGKYTGTLANIVSGFLLERDGSPICHAVNRLDRDTSGITLFAKSAYHKNLAVEALRQGEKRYIAILYGVLPEREGVIDLPIDREQEGFQRRVVRETGRPAVTLYRTRRVFDAGGGTVSQVELLLKTGRTHQIRVHCAALGAPVLGDRLYGTQASLALSETLGLQAHLLHAMSLVFPDPVTNAALTLTAPVRRGDLLKLWEKCGENPN